MATYVCGNRGSMQEALLADYVSGKGTLIPIAQMRVAANWWMNVLPYAQRLYCQQGNPTPFHPSFARLGGKGPLIRLTIRTRTRHFLTSWSSALPPRRCTRLCGAPRKAPSKSTLLRYSRFGEARIPSFLAMMSVLRLPPAMKGSPRLS